MKHQKGFAFLKDTTVRRVLLCKAVQNICTLGVLLSKLQPPSKDEKPYLNILVALLKHIFFERKKNYMYLYMCVGLYIYLFVLYIFFIYIYMKRCSMAIHVLFRFSVNNDFSALNMHTQSCWFNTGGYISSVNSKLTQLTKSSYYWTLPSSPLAKIISIGNNLWTRVCKI